MKTKIWKKNKEGKIEIIKVLEEESTTSESTRKVVAENIMKSLKENVDYGAIEIGKILSGRYNSFECSATTLAESIESNINTIISVCFTKKDGSQRSLTGYTNGDKDSFGRYYFHELTEDSDDQIRLVDPRELRWVMFYDKHRSQREEDMRLAGADLYTLYEGVHDHLLLHLKGKELIKAY